MLLERVGVRYLLRRKPRRLRASSDANAVHILDDRERAALGRIQRGAIVRGALAGALSTLIAAAAEVAANELTGETTEAASFDWRKAALWWAIVGGVTVVTAVLEILFLYWDALRSAQDMAHEAGLRLGGSELDTEQERSAFIAAALARAALELPNPPGAVFGVDPRREASRARLAFSALLYKAKVTATTFVAKALIRRALSRAAVRTVLPFIAVPITAGWNALVVYWVLREVRIRAIGASAAQELLDRCLRGQTLTRVGRVAVVRAVAAAIVRKWDMHPNLLELLRLARDRCPDVQAEQLDDPELFLASLRTLPSNERHVVMQVLNVATAIDGRLSRHERRLLLDARLAAGISATAASDLKANLQLRRALLRGEAVDDALWASLGHPLRETDAR